MTETTEEYDFSQSPIRVVTLTFSEDGDVPKMDLGDLNPWVAVSLLEVSLDALKMILTPPVITYDGDVVFEMAFTEDETE